MKVAALMNPEPATCRPDDSLHEAARKMWANSYGCMPVVDERGHAVGMLTDRDICLAAYMQEASLKTLAVDSAMTREVVACRPTHGVTTAEQLMRKHKVRRVMVADPEGQLVGLLSIDDLARASRSRGAESEKGLSASDIATTFAAVAERRNALETAPVRPARGKANGQPSRKTSHGAGKSRVGTRTAAATARYRR